MEVLGHTLVGGDSQPATASLLYRWQLFLGVAAHIFQGIIVFPFFFATTIVMARISTLFFFILLSLFIRPASSFTMIVLLQAH